MTTVQERVGQVRLKIKFNNTATNDRCELCWEWTESEIGPEVFLARTWSRVCDVCSEEIDPALSARLRLRQDRFVEVVQRFGDQLKNSELVAMIGMPPEES